jgi:lysozyme family protein
VSTKFDKAYEFTRRWEGGYVNHPNDPGGETIMGISRRAHPKWEGWSLVDSGDRDSTQLKDKVRIFYWEKYWRPIHGDSLPEAIAVVFFDYAVHSGVGRAARELQRLVGLRGGAVDGVVGPKTIHAVWQWLELQGALPYVDRRRRFLTRLTQRRAKLQVFYRGWMNRMDSLVEYLRGM